ncbi:hypothetical protein DOY81_014900 [Sarcophaga bullata]|nr:hypothetical protein DOY81_014900 [Sarcophaga bullata]
MLNFQVKSPGKIILHGEHAVVYHKPALAAVVGLGTTLKFTSAENGKRVVTVLLEALNTSFVIQVDSFNKFLKHCRTKFPQETFDSNAQLLEEPFTITVDTELNIGAGLGSSASYGAALAAAFLLYAHHFDINSYNQPENQALISQWAFESERIMHGTPSGIDNTVCTYGGMLRFVKGQGFQTLKIQRPLNILLVDSKVKRSTADIVAKVRHLWEQFPDVINSIWNACEALVNDAIPLYENFGNSQDDSEKFEKLERLFQINNDLMKAIGVTHPKLEQIFSIAFKRGFFSKLTGAGAGGYVIVLLPENYTSNEVYWKLKEELEAAGFGVFATTAGGDGLRMEQL